MLVSQTFTFLIYIWAANIITTEAKTIPSKDFSREYYGKRPTLKWRASFERKLLDKKTHGNYDKWCHPFSEKLVEILTT